MKKRIRALSILFTSIVTSFMLFIPQINAETVDDWVYTVDSFNKANGDYNDIIWDMNRNDFRLSGTTFEEDFTGYTRGSQFPNERWRLNFTKSDVKRILIASQQSKYGNKQLYLTKDATWNENAVVASDFSPTRRGQVEFTVKPSSGHVRVGLYHTPLKLVGESGNTNEFMVRFEPKRGRHKEGIRIGTNVGGNDPSRAAVLFLERKINWGSWYDIRLVWDLDKQSGIDVYVNGTRVARNFYSEMLKNQKNFYFYAIQLAVGTGSPSIEGTTGRGYFDYVRFRETGKNSGTFTSEPLKIPNGIVVDNNSQSINWSQGTSSNSTARVQTSVSKDGGKTWTSWKTVSRGSPVPDIPENTVLNNYQVRYRVTLTRTSSSYNPWVRNIEFNFQNSDKVAPKHISESVTGAYKNGNTYWAKPNDTVQIKLRGEDTGSLLERTNIRLQDANADVRTRYYYADGKVDHYRTHNDIEVTSAIKSYESSDKTIRETNFYVKPKSNNKTYKVSTYLRDFSGNTSGWVETPVTLATDGTPPEHISSSITGERYKSGSTYWVRPGDVLTIKFRQRDTLSGNQRGYIRFSGNNQDVRYFHEFNNSSSTHLQVVNSSYQNTSSIQVQSARRIEHNTSTGYSTAEWDVKLNTSGHQYNIQYYHRDNVNNNVGYTTVATARVDGVAPTLSISPNTTSYTRENVTLTATATDALSGVKRIRKPDGTWVNGSSTTYTVSTNGTYTFVAEDNVGNQRTQSITISNIDKTAPTADLTQSPTGWTNGNVTLKLSNIKDSGSGYYRTKLPNGSYVTDTNINYTVTSNGTYSFVIYDNIGNSTTKTIQVNNIDKVKPTASVSYSSTSETNKNVTITVTATDRESGIKSIRLPNGTEVSSSTVSYNVSQNGTYQFVVIDNAGNTTTVTAKVDNIDKTPPQLTLTFSPKEWTNNVVYITAVASDENGIKKIVLPNGESVSDSKAVFTATQNGTYSFTAYDTVNNTTTKSIEITNIDKSKPELDIKPVDERKDRIEIRLEYGDK